MHPLVKPFEECGLQRHSELHLAEQPASLASLFPAPPAFHPAYARDRHNSLDRDDRGDHGVRAVPNHPSGRDAGVPLRSHDGGDGDRHAAPKLDVNTNGSVYSQLFWLNPLLPKDHLNFLGYHEGIGPVCVSTLPSGESGWFHAFVRTPLRFALVQVPVTRLEGPEARALQRFLPPKAPHKLLLYFVMEAYFQQVDVGHVHYVRWKQEVERTAGPRPLPPLLPSIAESAGPAVLDLLGDSSFADDSADVSPSPPPQTLPPGERDLTAAVATLPAAPAPAPRTASAPAVITSPAKSVGWTLANPFDESVATSDVPSSTATLCDLLNETTFRPPSPSKAFNRSSMTARDLIDLVLAVEPLNGESLKPALRNLEPRLIRRYHEIDVLVGPREAHSASHLQFQRFLQVLGQPFNYQQLWATIPRTNTIPGSASSAPGSSSSGYGSAGGPTPPGGHPMDPLEETLYRPLKARSAAGMAERRQSILQELIYTERSYVQKLQALITVYVVPLRSASRSGKSQLIPPYMANAIFTNVEQLAAVNEAFLQDLERYESEAQCSRTGGGRSDPAGADEATPDAAQTGAGWLDDGPSLGQICYQHLCNFDVYKRYINGYQHALECSSQLEKKNESYRHFLARSRDHPSCHKLGISDLLVMPVQRIPRYTLLLTDLLKNTPVNHLDYADLQRALDRGHEIGHLADNQVADTLTELHTIHGHVAECPASLISASRRLLISIDATELDFSTSTILKHITLYLFTDRIMVVERPPHVTSSQSTSKKKVYKFLTWIELGAVEVLETVGPGSANRFYIQCHAAPCLDPYWETKPLHAYSVSGTNDRQRWVQRFYAAHALRRSALLHAEADGPSTGLPGTGSDLAAGSTTATTTAAAATTTTTTTTGSSLVTAATLASGNPPAPPTGPTTPKARKPSHRLYRQFHRDEHQIVFHLHFDVEQYLRSPHRCDTVLVYTDHAGIDLVGSELDPNLRQFVDHALAPPVDAHQYPHMVGIIKGQRGKVSLAMYNRSPVPLALGHQPIDDRQRATSAPPPLPPPMRSSSLSQDDAEDETPQTAATVAAALARASRLFGSSPVGPAYLGNPINRVDSGRASAISTRHNSFVVHDEDPSAEVDTVEPTGEAPVAGNPDGSFEHTTSASAASASAGEQGWVRAPKWVSSLADFEREFLEERK
ncbi:hypothetical protein IWQ60_005597 [Tieghemiomyces parasiticus]|uniref:DH domain-containing protein n=1 Tax=Tieghemiomyces parasiticus TaxID=78921 RepID=A0A9W8DUH3_9FUNG|nr:hypothetical protein IWQ60_005597 [Tieghemiomyces parasiticus]